MVNKIKPLYWIVQCPVKRSKGVSNIVLIFVTDFINKLKLAFIASVVLKRSEMG